MELVLTNLGTSPCGMFGFVGLQMLAPDGEALTTDVQRASSNRAAAEVVVPPTGHASAQLSWVDVDAGQGCLAPTGLAVSPPNDPSVVVAGWPVTSFVCQDGELDIEPIHGDVPMGPSDTNTPLPDSHRA